MTYLKALHLPSARMASALCSSPSQKTLDTVQTGGGHKLLRRHCVDGGLENGYRGSDMPRPRRPLWQL